MDASWREFAKIPNHLWELEHVGGDACFHIETYDYRDATTVLHTHNFIQVYYIHRGCMRHTVQDNAGNFITQGFLATGDIFILPPWFYHQLMLLTEDVLYTSICVSPDFISFDFRSQCQFCNFLNHLLTADVADKNVYPQCSISLRTQQAEVCALLNAMLREYEGKHIGYLTYIRGELLKLLVIIARQYCKTQADMRDMDCGLYDVAVRESIAYIDTHFTQDLKLDEIAKRAFVSRTQFCKLFKNITGTTFGEYLNHLRLNHSKSLLIHTNLGVAEVALRSGFNDVSNYCRQFKRAFAMSSSDFRKTNRKSSL